MICGTNSRKNSCVARWFQAACSTEEDCEFAGSERSESGDDTLKCMVENGKVGVMGNIRVLRCSFARGFMCCARVLRCSSSPRLLVCPNHVRFPRYPRCAVAGASKRRLLARVWKLTQFVTQVSVDVCWRKLLYPHEAHQVMTEDAGHQEKRNQEKRVENELMMKVGKMPCGSQYLYRGYQEHQRRCARAPKKMCNVLARTVS